MEVVELELETVRLFRRENAQRLHVAERKMASPHGDDFGIAVDVRVGIEQVDQQFAAIAGEHNDGQPRGVENGRSGR